MKIKAAWHEHKLETVCQFWIPLEIKEVEAKVKLFFFPLSACSTTYIYLKCSVTVLDMLQIIWTKLEKSWGNITQLFPQQRVPFPVKFVYRL